ncbi:hypothetical protein N9B82_00720 [Saprospiraceae bacterium]|nr:hypothetical protein [Saprospiraceae bacterium]
MKFLSLYIDEILIFSGAYFLLIIILLIKCTRFKNKGVETTAKVLSINSESYIVATDNFDLDNTITSTRTKGVIEYTEITGKLIRTKVSISGRYTTAEYKNKLPIIYNERSPEKPIINNDAYIYQLPIGLILILFAFGIPSLLILLISGK